jgi:hypothetical protein
VISHRPNSPIYFQLSGWRAVAAGLLAVAAVAAIGFFALGLFVLILPVLLIAPLVRYFLKPSKPLSTAEPAKRERMSGTIIDGNFTVVDQTEHSNGR